MVILYNRKNVKLCKIFQKTSGKKYKKNKHIKVKFSRNTNPQQITSANKKFLKTLGLKVLV